MARLLFAFLVVVAVFALSEQRSFGRVQCGGNEEFLTCGSNCEPACYGVQQQRACTYQCQMGCQCKNGFLRNNIGACVPQDLC